MPNPLCLHRRSHYNALAGWFLAIATLVAPSGLLAEPLDNTPIERVFEPPQYQEDGWAPLARLLEYLAPTADTSIPLSGTEINRRIQQLIQSGQAQEALIAIKRREQQLAAIQPIGTDVELLFLKAQAYTHLGEQTNAIAVYQQMTEFYPELPEPWNNLAVEYAHQGNLAMAEEALNMALIAVPNNATALRNLGEIRLLRAQAAFEEAAALK